MKTIICGDISNDDVMEWCIANKKFKQVEQFEYGYQWGSSKDSAIRTNNDHFFNGVRVAIREGKVDYSTIGIEFFIRDGKDNHHSTKIIIDPDGRIKTWPNGFFDGWDDELLRLL